MGSSSNATSSGDDKEEKGGKASTKDWSAEPSFKEGDRVLYEAKVQRIENLDDEWRYFVHYLGWNKK